MPTPKQLNKKPSNEPEVVLTGIWGFVSRKLGISPWDQILIVFVCSVSYLIFLGYQRLNSRSDDLQVKLDHTNERLAKVEGQIEALLAFKGVERLGIFLQKGDLLNANKETENVTRHLALAKALKAPVPQEFFKDSASIISASLSTVNGGQNTFDDLHKVTVALTEYSSAVQPEPDLNGSKKAIDMSIHTSIRMRINIKLLLGAYVVPDYIHGDIFVSNAPPKLSSNVVIDGPAVFVGMVPDASQTLDGFHWMNGVTFVNMRIRYNGGELELRDVRFVNCSFELANNLESLQLASALTSSGQPFSIETIFPG